MCVFRVIVFKYFFFPVMIYDRETGIAHVSASPYFQNRNFVYWNRVSLSSSNQRDKSLAPVSMVRDTFCGYSCAPYGRPGRSMGRRILKETKRWNILQLMGRDYVYNGTTSTNLYKRDSITNWQQQQRHITTRQCSNNNILNYANQMFPLPSADFV